MHAMLVIEFVFRLLHLTYPITRTLSNPLHTPPLPLYLKCSIVQTVRAVGRTVLGRRGLFHFRQHFSLLDTITINFRLDFNGLSSIG